MTSEMSKTQLDRLGDRLKTGNIAEADLRMLRTLRDVIERVEKQRAEE
jgi:hypothetical protein